MQANWLKYTNNQSNIWTEFSEFDEKYHDPLSPKAYLINRAKLRAKIVEIIPEVHWHNKEKLFPIFKIIAANQRPCSPPSCCITEGDSSTFIENNGCVASPGGIKADHYLWRLGKTYTINVPLITSEFGEHRGYLKTLKPMVDEKLRSQRKLINDLVAGQVQLPSFAKFGCTDPLPLY